MSRASRPLLIALALTTTVGLTACGDKKLSKADYIAKVDPICAKYKDQSDKIPEPKSDNDNAAVATYLTQIADLADKQTKEIDDVGRPKEGKSQIDDLLNRQRNEVTQIRAAADALKANDPAKANHIANDQQPTDDKIKSDLKAFGFKTCGSE